MKRASTIKIYHQLSLLLLHPFLLASTLHLHYPRVKVQQPLVLFQRYSSKQKNENFQISHQIWRSMLQ